MQFAFRTIAALAFAFIFSAAVFAQSPWIGIYEFVEDGGKNAGGTTIVVSHELQIMDSDKGLVATIKSNGYQTSVDILCLVKVEGNKATLFFEGYGDDNMFESYTKGQLILSLEDKGKSTLLTHWGKFKPIVPKNEKNGKVYFVRTPDKKI